MTMELKEKVTTNAEMLNKTQFNDMPTFFQLLIYIISELHTPVCAYIKCVGLLYKGVVMMQ